MNVIDFKEKWQLTHRQLADQLGYDCDWTVRSWFFTGKYHRNPHPVISVTCALLDEKWLRDGKIPPTTNTNNAPVQKYAISHR